MTIKTVSVAPEYLSFYIPVDDSKSVPPSAGIVATDQCINVGCLYWNDGNTTITLGPFEELPPQKTPPSSTAMLDTPEYRVVISDALTPEMLNAVVPSIRTRVRIWTNHKTEPDDVVIALG